MLWVRSVVSCCSSIDLLLKFGVDTGNFSCAALLISVRWVGGEIYLYGLYLGRTAKSARSIEDLGTLVPSDEAERSPPGAW